MNRKIARSDQLIVIDCDGEVSYYSNAFKPHESIELFNELYISIAWRTDILFMFGKRIETKRKVAWYGDKAYDYTYSKSTKTAIAWTPTLLKIKAKIEEISKTSYNCCLLNLYHDGSEGMGWHSDDEPELLENGSDNNKLEFSPSGNPKPN